MSNKQQVQIQQDDVLAMWSCAGNYRTKVAGSGNIQERNREERAQREIEKSR